MATAGAGEAVGSVPAAPSDAGSSSGVEGGAAVAATAPATRSVAAPTSSAAAATVASTEGTVTCEPAGEPSTSSPRASGAQTAAEAPTIVAAARYVATRDPAIDLMHSYLWIDLRILIHHSWINHWTSGCARDMLSRRRGGGSVGQSGEQGAGTASAIDR